MTTTREAAMEAALKLARNRLQACAIDHPTNSPEMFERSRWADEATASLSRLATPAAEPHGLECEIFAIAHSCDGYGWKYIDSGSGSDWMKRGMQYQDATLLYDTPARPAPQPAADTPALHDELATMISDLSHTGELSMLYRMEIADRITALRAIIGTDTPAPSDKPAPAVTVREAIREVWGCCEELEDEALAKLSVMKTEHEKGFWTGQKMTAKRIRRATQMPTAGGGDE